MAELTSQQRFDLWDQFIKTWPIEKLKELTLEEYNTLGSKNSFCYWLESKTEDLGSIWGGSAFKFGIFEFDPNSKNAKDEGAGFLKDDKYKWLEKYGKSASEAFEKIRGIILSIAKSAAEGNLSAIDSADLGHATKWKIAFLYQKKTDIKIPCVYLEDRLRAYAECFEKDVPSSEIYRQVIARKPVETDIFSFSQNLWSEVEKKYTNAWLIAPGENAYLLDDFITSNMIKIGWNEVGDLSKFASKNDLYQRLKEEYDDYGKKSPDKVATMLWDFCHEIKVGHVVFLKKGVTQIVGRGVVKSEYKKLDSGEFKHACDVEWTHIGTWDLPSQCAQKSLSKLKPDKCSQYEKLLADSESSYAGTENIQNEVSKMDKAQIPYALNTIFYGPPGTGKTRILLDEIAKEYFYEQVGQLTEAERNANVVAGLNWWEVIALCLLDNGDSAKVPKIMEHPLIAAHLKNSMSNNPSSAVWGQLQIHTKEDCEHVKYDLARRADPKVFSKSPDSTWTVDRDLITEIRPDLLERLKQYRTAIGVSEIKRYQFITFHQSYSYENFVEGISAETDDNGNIHYDIKPGIFWTFCQKAQNDPEHKYALFIDEINRGNVSGVFGELISLIEADKRGKLHTTLPYSKTDFYVPENLYIFGSMNTADRSIDALDSALRRRFAFVEMPPRPELLSSDEFKPKHISVDLCALLKALNRRVEFLLDRDHKIGHSYFMTIQAETAEKELTNLQDSFKNQIIPLLEDYFYGNLEKVQMVLGRKFIVPDEEQELTSACLMCGEDAVEFQDKVSLKVADLSTLTEVDFAELIK